MVPPLISESQAPSCAIRSTTMEQHQVMLILNLSSITSTLCLATALDVCLLLYSLRLRISKPAESSLFTIRETLSSSDSTDTNSIQMAVVLNCRSVDQDSPWSLSHCNLERLIQKQVSSNSYGSRKTEWTGRNSHCDQNNWTLLIN